MDALITKYFEENGELKKFSVYRDDTPFNCREDFENGDILCLWWGRYILGDNEGRETPHCILADLITDLIDSEIDTDELTENQMMVMLQQHPDKIVILPCYIYEHGGLSISTNAFGDIWDSGVAGFIYATKESVKITGTPWENVRAMMIEDVKLYNMYLNGEVYGYEYETENDSDSCWGFYSDKWGEDLFNELASEAGFEEDTKFYEENQIDVKVTITETRTLKKGN